MATPSLMHFASQFRLLTGMGFLLIVVWFSIAFDGRLHWDEPWYLYAGAYSLGEVLSGEFEPTKIEGFTFQRIGHILVIRLVTSLTGPGIAAIWLITGCYLVLLLLFAWVNYLILRMLTPTVNGVGAAVILLMFSPVYVYFAFKTLPEIPALLAASVSVLALVRSFTGRPVIWLIISALALLVVGLFRPAMALMFLSCVTALALCYGSELPRSKLLGHTLLSGLASLALFILIVVVLGIPLHSYWGFVDNALKMAEPLASVILHTALEGGLLFLALPLAFVSQQKRAAVFYAVWFILATLPILMVFQKIESRYLASNLIALAGLISLSVDGMTPRIRTWCYHRKAITLTASVAAAALIGSAALAQRIMTHGVDTQQLHELIRKLDQTYDQHGYAILTPDVFASFHYLRFVYPERKVYTVHTWRDRSTGEDDPQWPTLQRRFYGTRAIVSINELASLDHDDMLYVAFREGFPVANLRAMMESLSWTPFSRFLNSNLDKMKLMNHFEGSWMWQHPQIRLSEVTRSGHYVAMRVDIASRNDGVP